MHRTKGVVRVAVAAAFAAAISGPTVPADAAQVAHPADSAPALSIVKAADQTAVLTGDDIDYHLTVTNTGDVDLTNMTIEDPNARTATRRWRSWSWTPTTPSTAPT